MFCKFSIMFANVLRVCNSFSVVCVISELLVIQTFLVVKYGEIIHP